MKLRTKTWTVVLAAMFALLGVLLSLGGRAFLAGFERVELEQAALESERVLAVLERQRDDLERTARDYAEWDDTIAYAAGTMPAFAEVNLAATSLANLRVHLMLVYEWTGNPVGGARVPKDDADAIAASPQNFSSFADEVAVVLADTTANTRVKGFKRIGAMLCMFACAPLTTSESAPGPHGAFVIARLLDDSLVADLAGLVHHPVTLHVVGEKLAQSEAEFTTIAGTTIETSPSRGDRLVTHAVLRAVDGTPVATVHMELPRSIHRQAARTSWLIVAQVAGTALLFGVIFSVLLGRVVVLADNTQIQQVVMNLVKNAADAMDKHGRATLVLDEVSLPEAPGPGTDKLPVGRYARLTVRDTGPGIPPKLRERIFEPFFTTKGAGRGNGLGLAVVRSVVLRHNRALGLSSPPGEGATFFVYLPLHRFHEAGVPAVPAPAPVPGGRVLVVDDDPSVRQIVAKVIAKQGYEVITATDGQDGWELFEQAGVPFEVVLTDLTMPRLGGLQLGERIFNSGRRVPVLLMTAYAATLDSGQLRRAGFAALVAKPLDLEHLKQALADARSRN